MPYAFHDRLDHAGTRFKDMGESIVYKQGEIEAAVTGFKIQQDAEEIVPGVAVTRIEMQVWGIDWADLVAEGITAKPKHGDKITTADDHEFRVVSPGGDEPCFRWSTAKRNRLLIYTQWAKDGS